MQRAKIRNFSDFIFSGPTPSFLARSTSASPTPTIFQCLQSTQWKLKAWGCARQKWGCCHPMLYSSIIIQPPVLELGGPYQTLPAVHRLLGVVFVWLHDALSSFFALWLYTVLSEHWQFFTQPARARSSVQSVSQLDIKKTGKSLKQVTAMTFVLCFADL